MNVLAALGFVFLYISLRTLSSVYARYQPTTCLFALQSSRAYFLSGPHLVPHRPTHSTLSLLVSIASKQKNRFFLRSHSPTLRHCAFVIRASVRPAPDVSWDQISVRSCTGCTVQQRPVYLHLGAHPWKHQRERSADRESPKAVAWIPARCCKRTGWGLSGSLLGSNQARMYSCADVAAGEWGLVMKCAAFHDAIRRDLFWP